MQEPWKESPVVEVEWHSYECLGKDEATRKMNNLSAEGAKTMSIHFVGLGQEEKPLYGAGLTQVKVVPIFIIFALEPVKKAD